MNNMPPYTAYGNKKLKGHLNQKNSRVTRNVHIGSLKEVKRMMKLVG